MVGPVPSLAKLHLSIIENVRKNHDQAAFELKDIKFQPGGIFPSEAFLLSLLIQEQQLDLFVESGRRHGYSTEVIANACPGIRFASIDREPNKAADKRLRAMTDADDWVGASLELIKGDGAKMVSKLTAGGDLRKGVFLDGPKGSDALEIVKRIRDRVAFVAIHDLSRRHQGETCYETNPQRINAEKNFQPAWFSDDEQFTALTSYMDKPAWSTEYTSRGEMCAIGFSVAVFPGGQWKPF